MSEFNFSKLRSLCYARRMARPGHGVSIRTHQRRIAAERDRLLSLGADPFVLHAFIIRHSVWHQDLPCVRRAIQVLEGM